MGVHSICLIAYKKQCTRLQQCMSSASILNIKGIEVNLPIFLASILPLLQGKMNTQASYVDNSQVQTFSIKTKVIPIARDALEGLYKTMLPKCVMAAELGCAVGPNTFLMIPQIIDVTYNSYRKKSGSINGKNDVMIPEIKVFLNDLPENDFNIVSRSLASFHKRLVEERHGDVGPYFISMTPGSFHKRIFPSNSLHFVHTSNSAHYLSQVPKGLRNEKGEQINKGNIYITKTSPTEVLVAYQQQFEQDFTSFLELRGREIVSGGRMVVNITASTDTSGPQDVFWLEALNIAIKDMAHEGLVDEKKLDEFDIPYYPPALGELKKIIKGEGSFSLQKHEIFIQDWELPKQAPGNNDRTGLKENSDNGNDLNARVNYAVGSIKTGTSDMMAAPFGEHLMEDLYRRVTQIFVMRLANGGLKTYHHIISLIRNLG